MGEEKRKTRRFAADVVCVHALDTLAVAQPVSVSVRSLSRECFLCQASGLKVT